MQLKIDKIGKIEKATIDINGLTVIAGKNDTGKSTVGKVLYAVFRALEMYLSYFDQRSVLRLESRHFRPLLKKYTELDSQSILGQLCDKLVKDLRDATESEVIEKDIVSYEKMTDIIDKMKLSNPKVLEQLSSLISETETALNQIKSTSNKEKFARTVSTTLRTMFLGDINNSKYHESASLALLQDSENFLSMTIIKDDVSEIIFNTQKLAPFANAIYIETPFILEKIIAYFKPNWMELVDKIERVKKNIFNDAEINDDLLRFIQREILHEAIIGFDDKEDDFFYQVDSTSSRLPLTNAACGVRSFALMFLLLKYNLLTRDILLVLDEPENHLHPEWQIKYAEMVALLVKQGFSVVLTSHSPTFIQALGAYSSKYQIQEKASFYLAEQVVGKNYSQFTNVTKNLQAIYMDLVQPVEKLFTGV